MTRKRALVICPGRGTYNRKELGYFRKHHQGKQAFRSVADRYRRGRSQTLLSTLDEAPIFDAGEHTRGDNASALIYACAYCDFLDIDRAAFDIVGITGNSMGWYIALACAGSVTDEDGFHIVNTMGTLMQQRLLGGQLLYPFVDDGWREIPGKRGQVLSVVEEVNARPEHFAALSIELGGTLVLGGNELGVAALMRELPAVQGRFPMRLQNHAAFHTKLQEEVAEAGRRSLSSSLFSSASTTLVDGRGHICYPISTRASELYGYTLGEQVTGLYDFSKAIANGVRELAPEALIVLGPGNSLGVSVAQVLIRLGWRGIASRADFEAQQANSPLVVCMGDDAQRRHAVAG